MRPVLWLSGAVATSLMGMATKEVVATAPLLIFIYDRTFIAGTFKGAWERRKGLYIGLAATWLPLALLVAGTGGSRHGSAGFTGAVEPTHYWLTQFRAVADYLRLTVWPRTLVFDYGTNVVRGPLDVLPQALLVLALLALTVVALIRRPPLGFLGAWFFCILAPTSIVPVATQTMAEHRMYLPLAAVIMAIVLALYVLTSGGLRCWIPLAAAAIGLGIATLGRNEVYRSGLSLWEDTVAKQPDNARAHCSLGLALSAIPDELLHAISEYERAIQIHPNFSDAHFDLGIALESVPGRHGEAIDHFQEALQIRPDFPDARLGLAKALAQESRIPEAIQEYQAALRDRPTSYEALSDYGALLCGTGNVSGGIEQLNAALQINPDYPRAHFFMGNALVQSGNIPDAIGHYEAALRAEPNFAEASNNLGMVLCRMGRTTEGLMLIEAAIRIRPDFAQAHFARGAALLQAGRVNEAVEEYNKLLELKPGDPSALRMLDLIRSRQ